jgi:AAA+ ATPase superfamily predicted ATPase
MNKELNPFVFGGLALDSAFTDREDEVRELSRDMLNGQDVVVYAPRRYGKSSLVLRAAQEAIRNGVRVGYCDLMKTPTKERFAAALAKTIAAEIDSPAGAAVDRVVDLFRSLRVTPSIEVDPADGSLRFVFQPSRRRADIDDTIEQLLELPARIAAERKRRVALVFDEFQEIVSLDRHFPNLMRAVFQAQPEVGHVYLGSRRHTLDRIFSDRNAPFWRSAKRVEIGPISRRKFGTFLKRRFDKTDKGLTDEALERLLDATGGHPYATQELAHFVWESVPTGHFAYDDDVEAALERVLRSEHNHFAKLWEDASYHQRLVLLALAEEPTPAPYARDYHERHELPANPSLQTALAALGRKEVVGRGDDGTYVIVEPFFAEWLRREQRDLEVEERIRRQTTRATARGAASKRAGARRARR